MPPKKAKATADESNTLAAMTREITNEAMESSEALLNIWTRFNDKSMEESKQKAEELKLIKDVKVDRKKATILVDSWGIDRIEALTMLKRENDDLNKCMLMLAQ